MPNSSATANDDDDDDMDVLIGIIISLMAAAFYGLGLCIQRAALTASDSAQVTAPGCGGPCCLRFTKLNWLVGLSIYGIGGLGLGTLALSYVTLATSSALFSSCLVFNAIIARLWLKEEVNRVDIAVYTIIIAGLSVAAVWLPKVTTTYNVEQTADFFFDEGGIVFWCVAGSTLVTFHVSIYRMEKKYNDYKAAGKRVYRTAMVLYPSTLGLLEGVAFVGLKAANNIYDLWSAGDTSQKDHWLTWFGIGFALPLGIWVVIWIRKSYGRFPTTQIFPIELGALTLVSSAGGLFVYEEYRVATWGELTMIYLGMSMMASGMVTLAFKKNLDLEDQAVPWEGDPPDKGPTQQGDAIAIDQTSRP
jgi:hypothetical protein